MYLSHETRLWGFEKEEEFLQKVLVLKAPNCSCHITFFQSKLNYQDLVNFERTLDFNKFHGKVNICEFTSL